MPRTYELGGIGVVNATPLTASGEINLREYRRHVHWLADEGVRFLQPAAATGQMLQTTEGEYRRLLEATVDEVGDRVFVTAYSGRASTDETIRLTRLAKEIGAHAAFIIQPYFSRPDPEGIYLHYRAVAEAVDLPIVFYNNPDRAGVNLPIDIMERLVAESDRFVGLKQSDLNQLADSFLRLGSRIRVMAKSEKEILMGLALGAPGALTFAGNIVPGRLVQILDAWNRGDHDVARRLFYRILPLINIIHIEPVPAAVKHMLNRLGWDFGQPRLPSHPLSADHAPAVDRVLRELELM
ncbi:MAG: dihydrodipicolinate synthase family protein [Ardenticatenaceae bacterium]|nr:dihydrodipicolinate synthase family protein [Ardenticatenaceae bacterium]